ncbi:MAG: LuxR family transcriptional regulator, partial [Actinobacteria bacterium]|nr:LuxR family transcriptional regulator [Actinomycetota bacterium]
MAEAQLAMTDLSDFRTRRAVLPEPLPAGTVTFLLTDIESSTRTWESHAPAMADAVARHYEILDRAISAHGGVRPVEQGEGDSLVAVFPRATDAVAAAAEAQRALSTEPWPEGASLAVRIAIHTGEAQFRGDRYYTGPSIIRCARLRALAHGGQVLISAVTADLLVDGLPAGAALLPLGTHRLRDLRHPERIFQLAHPELPADFPPLRSLDALPNNLPVHLTTFVGREPALAELGALLDEHRLVTLVGAGGSGKTRLAAQLAAEVAECHPDGVWWAGLAAVGDLANVAWTVMSALGMGDDRGLDPVGRITGCLRDTRTLLVLDNCEHVLDAVADLADRVLRSCPNVAVLATSREPLGVSGEVAWRVPPLSLPGEGESSRNDILRSEGVRLFVERARDARPSFEVDDDNATVLGAICSRLDGLPLAIELAAARIRSLPPQRILDGLSDRFRLLTGGARTATARQKTLHASVEWSHDLLGDEERVLFRRLAAFAGGFSLEAAEAVAATDPLEAWEVLGLLSDLVDKSLVVFDGERYRLLQTILDFATAQLLRSGETDEVRDRHAAWFLDVAESASADLERELRPARLAALAVEHDNLRVALEWSMAKDDDDLALRLVVALGFFWIVHAHYTEGLAWHRRVLARVPRDRSTLRCRAVWALGHMSLNCAEVSNGFGTEELTEAIEIARGLDDPALLARPLGDMGAIQNFGLPGDAEATFVEALDAARQAGDEWALAHVLWWQ